MKGGGGGGGEGETRGREELKVGGSRGRWRWGGEGNRHAVHGSINSLPTIRNSSRKQIPCIKV